MYNENIALVIVLQIIVFLILPLAAVWLLGI
jgi:hypothetical protein